MPNKLTGEIFIERANEIHKNSYDYSLVDFKGTARKVTIICLRCNGRFLQKPSSHLRGQGCISCAGTFRKTIEEFVEMANEMHENKFDYSLAEYKNNKTKVKIICKKCNQIFLCRPDNHLNKKIGCPKCSNNFSPTTEEFIRRAKRVHGDKYGYEKVVYQGNKNKVNILCLGCNNEFMQSPNCHVNFNQGCPKCSFITSDIENRWLDLLKINKEFRQRKIIINGKKYRVDAYAPDTNTIYEFLGDFWHGNPKKYQPEDINSKNKKKFGFLYIETMNRIKLFEENGYNVSYIWESDFSC